MNRANIISLRVLRVPATYFFTRHASPRPPAQDLRVLWGAKRLILSQDTQLARGKRRGELDGVVASSVRIRAYDGVWTLAMRIKALDIDGVG